MLTTNYWSMDNCKCGTQNYDSDTHRQHTDAERGLQQTLHLSSSEWAPQSAQQFAGTPPPEQLWAAF